MEQLIYRVARVGGQAGVALIMVLIMLAAMMIAGVALIRVVDSANMISGNFAFRQATLNIADLGVEAAVAELKAIRETSSEAPYPAGCRYIPAQPGPRKSSPGPFPSRIRAPISCPGWIV